MSGALFDRMQFRDEGICRVSGMFSNETIRRWNERLDRYFLPARSNVRAEIDVAELFELAIVDEFLTPAMRALIREIMPDAVLYHFHVYEIEAHQNKPHILSERFDGWHTDIRPLPGLDMREPHYVSIFVYLTDVSMDDGAFEISRLSSQDGLTDGASSIRVTGPAGTTFAWNRSFYHRASPNRGPIRRRLLKISIQHNYLENDALSAASFRSIFDRVAGKDEYLEFLLGKYHQASHHGLHLLPEVRAGSHLRFDSFPPNSHIRIPLLDKIYTRVRALVH
jgi:hypothetical protein